MSKIPRLLKTISGETINSAVDWERFRRREILHLFEEYVYGVRDIERPENLHFRIKSEKTVKDMLCREIECGFDDFSFPFTLYFPENMGGPLRAFVYILHEYHENNMSMDEKGNFICGVSCIPVKDITKRGYAVAIMPTRSIYRDWNSRAHYSQGIFRAVKPVCGRRKNSWATISAWAWGASRVMDYLETEKHIDCSSVAVIGHSRGGKTALWTAATDVRFKLAVSSNSGCMGAAILRGKKGEHVKDINMSDWFCENFRDFSDHEKFLPVDQHMLLALIAPRYIYVTSSADDAWADPEAEFKACLMANEVYELYNDIKGLVAPAEGPELEKPYHGGHIAYHVKKGGHSITDFDWKNIMDYADRIM